MQFYVLVDFAIRAEFLYLLFIHRKTTTLKMPDFLNKYGKTKALQHTNKKERGV